MQPSVIIIIKYIFQFRFIAFNDPQEVSSSLSKTHCYLKNHGLWRDDTEFRQDLDRVVEANKASVRLAPWNCLFYTDVVSSPLAIVTQSSPSP
ncbi:unnamed protein product, partial [Dibothriocephalus latus]